MIRFVFCLCRVTQSVLSKPKMSNINRSESYKERIHHKVMIHFILFEFKKNVIIMLIYFHFTETVEGEEEDERS